MVARRRRNRATELPPEAGDGSLSVQDLAASHLLLVPSTVDVWALSSLLVDRFPESDLAGNGEVSLGRHSRISGPYELSMEDAVDAGVPMPWTVCYCLHAPVEREDPPLEGLDDRDGFSYAFPGGLPWRDEGRALELMVALARRVAGAVRVAGSPQLIQPDPDRAVDHVVHAPTWLEPEVLLGVVSRDLPGARLMLEGADWTGPPDEAYLGTALDADAGADHRLSAEALDALHTAADRSDLETLAGPDVLDAFAIATDLGPDGVIEVLVHLTEPGEPALVGQPWAADEPMTYEVRWASADPAEREQRYPSDEFLDGRDRVAPLVRAVTLSIVEATSGVVRDEDGFAVDRYSLHPR